MNRQQLEQPFDPSLIRKREGDDGKMYEYFEGAVIVQRLNEVFDSSWDFKILHHQILENEVIVLGELTAGGIVKNQFGSVPIVRRKKDKTPVSIGDDLKKAGTDALKKCATLLGVGLQQLYLDKSSAAAGRKTSVSPVQKPAQPVQPAPVPMREAPRSAPVDVPVESSRVTAKQIRAITSLTQQRGWTQRHLRDFTMERYRLQPDSLSQDQAAEVIARLQLQQAVRV